MAFTDTLIEATPSGGGQWRSTFLGRLKEEFVPAWEDHVHTKLVIAKIIASKKGTMGGRRQLSSVMASYPQSSGIALGENDDMPTPRVGTYFNPSIFSRAIYSRLRWTGHVERATRKGDKVSWATARTEDLRTSRIQFEINFARMLYLGPYQVLATVKSIDTGTDPDNITLYNRNDRNSQANGRNRYGAHYLRVGMPVMHVDDSGGNVLVGGDPVSGDNYANSAGTERYVAAIDASGSDPVITVRRGAGQSSDTSDFATAPGANSILIPFRSRFDMIDGSDDADYDSQFHGPNGLMNMAVDSTVKSHVFGQSRTTYPSLNAFMVNNGSSGVRAFNEDYIVNAVDQITDDGTGDDPDVIVCHKSVRREYVKEIKGDRRFPEVITNRGFSTLKQTVGDVALPLQTDRDCMPGVMWVLESAGFGWFSEADLSMVDDGERFVSNKDGHEILMVKAGNGITKKPHNNAMVDDILYSVTGLTDVA